MTTTDRISRHQELSEEASELRSIVECDRAFTARIGITDEQIAAFRVRLAEIDGEAKGLLK